MALNPAELTVVESNTDSFSVWLEKTNELINSITSNVVTTDTSNTGGVTIGNSYVDGVFAGDVLVANTELRGGNVQTVGTLLISSDAQFGRPANTTDVVYWSAIDVNGTIEVNGTITTEILEISVQGNALSDGIPLGNSSHGFEVYARNLFVSGDGTFEHDIDVANTVFTYLLDVSGSGTIDNNLTVGNTVATFDLLVTHEAELEDVLISNTGSIQAMGTANGEGIPIGNNTHRFILYGTTIYGSNSVNVGANVVINTTAVKIGNSTVNTSITSAGVTVANTLAINSTAIVVGPSGGNNVTITTNAIDVDGTTTTDDLVVENSATLNANLTLNGSLLISQSIVSNNVVVSANSEIVTSNSETTIDSTTVSANAGIFSIKYLIAGSKLSNTEISQGMMVTEILALYDGSSVQSTQYASLESNTDVTISFTLVGTTLSLVVDCNDISAPANYYIFNVQKTALRNVL